MGLDKIEEYKRKLGLTTSELAEKSGIPKSTLDKILSGVTKDPKLETLKAIARVLEMTLDDFDDTDERESFTLAAHFEGDEYTEDELEEIENFANFVKSRRNKE